MLSDMLECLIRHLVFASLLFALVLAATPIGFVLTIWWVFNHVSVTVS